MTDWTKTFEIVKSKFPDSIKMDAKTIPLPWNPSGTIRAIILGADPANKHNHEFKYPFGLVDHGEKPINKNYFRWLLDNLKAIEVDINQVYVQNVCPFYLNLETSKNKNWNKIAELCLNTLIAELNHIDSSGRVPIFASCLKVFEFLSANPAKLEVTKFYYDECRYQSAGDTKIGRNVLYFSRSIAYKLKPDEKYPLFLKRQLSA